VIVVCGKEGRHRLGDRGEGGMTLINRWRGENAVGLAAMLARAFYHDPLYTCVFPDPAERETGLAWDMGNLLRYGLLYGEVLVTEDLAASAVCLPPGETDFTEDRVAAAGMLGAAAALGPEAAARLHEFDDVSDKLHSSALTHPHWYLAVLGVEPARQGRGLGSTLLDALVEKAERLQAAIYLETLNPANLTYYERWGFEVRAVAALSNGGVPVWGMVRQAGARLQAS
jgi:ribosomal protein S18 acetylase RimI-like enzyme